MRVPSHFARADISENMMTPMIDVVFNLLIFFVCASALNIQELVLKADLASEGSTPGRSDTAPTIDPLEAPVDSVSIRLSQRADGRTIMRLNDTDYDSFEALRDILRELSQIAPESPVILHIEPDVESGEMIRVYDTCRAARFQSIQFAAGPESAP